MDIEQLGENMRPATLNDKKDRYDAFDNGEVLRDKKKGHLPAMGWNSWNAFGSNNTEKLTRAMADKIIELGLDKLGYEYIVLDDGCYKPERVDGRLANNPERFPSGFNAISDYVHGKGLKFGMYNDIGEKLCSGAAVGTCGYETVDTKDYINWDIDFIKVDNCYYLWDNATFSNPDNAKYVYAPKIKAIRIEGAGINQEFSAVEAKVTGTIGKKDEDKGYVYGLGTYDGTSPEHSPIDVRSSELLFEVTVDNAGKYKCYVCYSSDKTEGAGNWLQLAVGDNLFHDDFLKETESDVFEWSEAIDVELNAGLNTVRLMNHRRQENTLQSYATFLQGLNDAKPGHDIILSICEWGKTQPQNWGLKVGDSWRILNDITFQVGDDGNNGACKWLDEYTNSICSQYNKAVIMDEFAGLDKGWNDPDMLVIGMDGVTNTMARTHMALWCMMNSPLMLGMDLRRVEKDDEIYQIIANKQLIALNQDLLGIQAKRIYCSLAPDGPDKEYVRDINRVDILAKPLADNSVALCFVNVSDIKRSDGYSVRVEDIVKYIGNKLPDCDAFAKAKEYEITDLWTGETKISDKKSFDFKDVEPTDHVIVKVKAIG